MNKVTEWVERPGDFFTGLTDKAKRDAPPDAAAPEAAAGGPGDPDAAAYAERRTHPEGIAVVEGASISRTSVSQGLVEECTGVEGVSEVHRACELVLGCFKECVKS